MLLLKKLSIFLTLTLSCHLLYSQQIELTEEDKEAIKYKSKDFIGELVSLLNLIKDPTIEAIKRKEIIENSYTPSANQLFLDENVIIEDDIDPNFFDYTSQKNSEVPKYLSDLELFYEKSEAATISIDNIEAYDVSQKDYIFLPVYFETTFKGKHIVIDRPYGTVQRIATIKAEKEDGLWKALIVSIVFYNPTIHTFVGEAKRKKLEAARAAAELIKALNQKKDSVQVLEKVEEINMDDALKASFLTYPTNARKGKTNLVRWQTGEWEENAKLELYQDSRLINILDDSNGNGNYMWTVPKTLELNQSYKLKLTNTADDQKAIFSPEFKIKRGFPLGIKILGAGALVGTAVFLLTSGGGDDPGGGTPVTPPVGGGEDLADPTSLPDGG